MDLCREIQWAHLHTLIMGRQSYFYWCHNASAGVAGYSAREVQDALPEIRCVVLFNDSSVGDSSESNNPNPRAIPCHVVLPLHECQQANHPP